MPHGARWPSAHIHWPPNKPNIQYIIRNGAWTNRIYLAHMLAIQFQLSHELRLQAINQFMFEYTYSKYRKAQWQVLSGASFDRVGGVAVCLITNPEIEKCSAILAMLKLQFQFEWLPKRFENILKCSYFLVVSKKKIVRYLIRTFFLIFEFGCCWWWFFFVFFFVMWNQNLRQICAYAENFGKATGSLRDALALTLFHLKLRFVFDAMLKTLSGRPWSVSQLLFEICI